MTEYILRRHQCETPFAFDLIRRAWRREKMRVAVKRDALGRFASS